MPGRCRRIRRDWCSSVAWRSGEATGRGPRGYTEPPSQPGGARTSLSCRQSSRLKNCCAEKHPPTRARARRYMMLSRDQAVFVADHFDSVDQDYYLLAGIWGEPFLCDGIMCYFDGET